MLDIGLPGMDGYEVAQNLRAGGKSIRIAALTGYGQEEDPQKGRVAGFAAHFTTLVEHERLFQWVNGGDERN